MALANALLSFRDKTVLEVGGCTPGWLIKQYDPLRWTSVDLNSSGVEQSNKENNQPNIQYIYNNICTYETAGASYDLAYSINSFEHISDVEVAINHIYKLLKNDGYLFTVFGPIWSSHVGHHLSIHTKYGEFNFANNILPPWLHLKGPDHVYKYISDRYDNETAQKTVDYIFYSNDLNRLQLKDYKNIIKNSPFNVLATLYHYAGPMTYQYSRVKEILWVLKKGPVTPQESISCKIKLFYHLFKILTRKAMRRRPRTCHNIF